MKYQGRKRCKTTNNLVVCDNNHHILAISGNHNDGFEITENIDVLIETLKKAYIDIEGSHLNADAGFDIQDFVETIEKKQNDCHIPKTSGTAKNSTMIQVFGGIYLQFPQEDRDRFCLVGHLQTGFDTV